MTQNQSNAALVYLRQHNLERAESILAICEKLVSNELGIFAKKNGRARGKIDSFARENSTS